MESRTPELKQIHIKLDAALHQALKLEATYNDITIQELVVGLIEYRISRSEFGGLIEGDD